MSATFAVGGANGESGLLDADCPDVYFTSAYGTATAAVDSGRWQVAHEHDRLIVPYVSRPASETETDAVTPYGYAGVHVDPGCSSADLARFWSRTVAHWRQTRTVTVFLRFSPLDPASLEAVRRLGQVDLAQRQDTICVTVSQGPDRVWDGMQGRARTAIRKAHTCGLTAAVRPAGPPDLVPGSPFRRLYESTMIRLESQPWYLFPDHYYRQLAAGLDKALSLAEVRDAEGNVVASALVLRHRDRAHYHLAGSDPTASRLGANNLLVWTILSWAAESGCRVVHLGGGVRPDDGLFRFKRSFGGTRTSFWTGSMVVDPDRYPALVAARARQLGRSTDELVSTGFFPAYRATVH
ncbi:GNAT family N-acetyltransferase [Micromonospora sp. WMMD1120]|uniref:lipid II:glycine glycyltransferase FemX n=1 Tax=Micromonospora sp. WMMD1120 TaxID=3016106 RepID=UPI0024173986|nr:GNAT family N-acetyltransferase [Micromonospora sp. WMMD1120]MDG4809027.1 GNAT family N-acetyltransferase [Micromonospora sp. WMMD1120]